MLANAGELMTGPIQLQSRSLQGIQVTEQRPEDFPRTSGWRHTCDTRVDEKAPTMASTHRYSFETARALVKSAQLYTATEALYKELLHRALHNLAECDTSSSSLWQGTHDPCVSV